MGSRTREDITNVQRAKPGEAEDPYGIKKRMASQRCEGPQTKGVQRTGAAAQISLKANSDEI